MKSEKQSMRSFIMPQTPSLFIQGGCDGFESWIRRATEFRLIQFN